MQRRQFLEHSLLAGASLLSAGTVLGNHRPAILRKAMAEKPFNLNYAFHDGMFRNHAGPDFLDQIKFGYDMGFRSIEDNGLTGRTPEMQTKIGETLARLGMTIGVFVLNKGGNSA